MIVGAAALFGLLVLYLLKLLRRPLRVSSVRFWPIAKDETQVNAPWRAFRFSWLFLLHLAVLACAVFALARPVIVADVPAGDRVVVMLDTSASMGCIDPGESESRMERAKVRAIELVEKILEDDGRTVSVLNVASETKVATGFTRSKSVARAAIEGARVLHQPADIVSAMELAGLLLGSDERSVGAIVLLSDGSFDDRTETGLSSPVPLRFERIGYSETPSANVGITEFSVLRDSQTPSLIRVFARVTLNEAASTSVSYTLAVDGDAVDSGTLRAQATTGVRDLPLSMSCRVDRQAVISLTIAGGDALSADDAAHATIQSPPQPRISLITEEGNEAVSGRRTFLFDVLSELPSAEIVRMTPAEFSAMKDPGTRFDLVVADVDTEIDAPSLPTLSFGAMRIGGVNRQDSGESGAAAVSIWDREDPVFDGISIDALTASRRHRFSIDAGERTKVIAQGTAGALAVRVNADGIDRIALPFSLQKSNFPLLPEFPIFIANCIDVLTARAARSTGVAWSTDQSPILNAVGEGTIALIGDAPFTHRVTQAGPSTVGRVGYVGLYQTEGCEEEFVAVNLVNRNETQLQAPMNPEFNGMTTSFAAPGRSVRELTPVALAILLALLIVEWIVFGLRSRI